MSEFDIAILYFDGGCKTQKYGPGVYGYIIYSATDKTKTIQGKGCIGEGEWVTSNVAEYFGVLSGLKRALELRVQKISIRGDSELIIRQLNKEYACRAGNLIPYYGLAVTYLMQFAETKFMSVPREKNIVADKLCNDAYTLPPEAPYSISILYEIGKEIAITCTCELCYETKVCRTFTAESTFDKEYDFLACGDCSAKEGL